MNIRNLMALIMVTTGLFAQSVMGTVFDATQDHLKAFQCRSCRYRLG